MLLVGDLFNTRSEQVLTLNRTAISASEESWHAMGAILQNFELGSIAPNLASPSQSHRPQNESHIQCRKSRCKGGTGRFDGLGGQRLIRHILAQCYIS